METKPLLTSDEFLRLANNFYIQSKIDVDKQRLQTDANLINYILGHSEDVKKRFRVAFVWICLNPPYWEFAKPMIDGAKQFFLPGHDVDYFLWSDMPKTKEEAASKIFDHLKQAGVVSVLSSSVNAKGERVEEVNVDPQVIQGVTRLAQDVETLHKMDKVTIFPLDSIEWPMPTLLRYHTFLQQEEILKDYDYIFYCDVDMAFVNVVGDEILGEGLTTGVNPMYWLDKSMWPPYEPNPASAAYIPRPGRVIDDNGQKRFQPLYYAGGFQGGKADLWIKAMKQMRKMIDKDFGMNYIPIWNEESIFNRYLFENPPAVVLDPSYIYPDSLIKEYYEPRWGRAYMPRLITLTKKFSLKQLTPEEQAMLTKMQTK